jgi:hypothetical protein
VLAHVYFSLSFACAVCGDNNIVAQRIKNVKMSRKNAMKVKSMRREFWTFYTKKIEIIVRDDKIVADL